MFQCCCFPDVLVCSVPVFIFTCVFFFFFIFAALFLFSVVLLFRCSCFPFSFFSDVPVFLCLLFFQCSCFPLFSFSDVPVFLCLYFLISCFSVFPFLDVPVFQCSSFSVPAVWTLRPVGVGCVDGTKTVASWSYFTEKTGYSLVHSDIQVCTYHTRQDWNARDTKVSSLKTAEKRDRTGLFQCF